MRETVVTATYKVIQNWFDVHMVEYIVDGVGRHVGYNRRTRGIYGKYGESVHRSTVQVLRPEARDSEYQAEEFISWS